VCNLFLYLVFSNSRPGPPDNPNLLRSSLLGRLVLHYQKLQLEPENTTLSWLYTPHSSSPCHASGYRVNIYTPGEIFGRESQNTLVAHQNFPTPENNITISSHFFKDHENSTNFFRVSALRNNSMNEVCAETAYFNNFTGKLFTHFFFTIALLPSTSNTDSNINVNERSLEFAIPEDFLNDFEDTQLIWSKDSNTQCVCPIVERHMSRCACNVENTDRNFITISDNMITISNITRDIDEGELRLYFVSSVSSGCNNACNLRSIKSIYRLITTPGKYFRRLDLV
jgi:hypothetical protein